MLHEDLVLSCSECDFKAKNKGGLTRHMNTKHKPNQHNATNDNILNMPNDEDYFSCIECSYKTKVTLEYINHAQYAHSEKQNLICVICKFQTPNGEGFISHLDLFH